MKGFCSPFEFGISHMWHAQGKHFFFFFFFFFFVLLSQGPKVCLPTVLGFHGKGLSLLGFQSLPLPVKRHVGWMESARVAVGSEQGYV